MSLKSKVKLLPGFAPARRLIQQRRFPGSSSYWEGRYKEGGNSGVGSYGEIARFKADFLNRFVSDHQVQSVIEFGCGDGAQVALASYPSYIGLDVSRTAIDLCAAQHGTDTTKSFLFYEPARFINHGALKADLGISLDVILHLVEDDVLHAYLRDLNRAALRYIIFFTEDQKVSPIAPHVRYRNVADWAPQLTGWRLTDTVENPHRGLDSQADFFVFERR